MERTDQLRTTRAPERQGGATQSPSITPVFPLLLLETMRDMDRPPEVLEDEDVTISLPRRLGLSDVVGVQIRRFQEELRQRRLQAPGPVEDLIRLVIRRPDAEEIFAEAGRRVAQQAWKQRSSAARRVSRLMPRALARVIAIRAARRLLRQLAGGSKVVLNRWPIELRIDQSLTARADPGGAACAFYAGVLAEHLQLYMGRIYRVRHPHCEARGGTHCQWIVEIAS